MPTLSPETLQEISLRVAKANAERYKAAVEETAKVGWGIWSLRGDKAFFEGIRACTLDPDWPLVITDGYLELVKLGVLPELVSLKLWRQESQQAQQVGQQLPWRKEFFWGAILDKCPPWVFENFQKRFISLTKKLLAEAEAV